jgi:UPF0755 protein
MFKKKKSYFRLLILIIILLVIGYFGFQGYLGYLKSPVDTNGASRAFVIQEGWTALDIAKKLEEEKIIRSAFIFKQELKKIDSTKIQSGDFILSPAMNVEEVIKELTEGSVDKKVTLIEGWRVEQMADELNKKLGIEKSEFIKEAKPYEGSLFPDTYFFNPKVTISDIILTLRNTFNKRYSDDLKQKIKAKGLTDKEGVILASLIEREARSQKVRTEVAGVLLNRLDQGMKLDIDATVQYAKDSQSLQSNPSFNKFWQPITQAEYSSIKSPYNTYLNPGLPPSPIANPSLSSFQAIADANVNSPYLFYFHDSQGNSYYAKTLEEHNENVAKYR